MCITNANAVQSCLSKNYLTQKFIAQNIHDLQYTNVHVHACEPFEGRATKLQ